MQIYIFLEELKESYSESWGWGMWVPYFLFRMGKRFYSRLRNKAKRCTDTDSVIVDAPFFPACPSGLVRPISMRILS